VYKYGMIVRAEAESRGMHFADARVIAVFGMLVAIVFLSVGTGILCLVISQIFKFFRQAVPEEQPKEPLMLVADLRN
jgi:Na+-transporting methylmalonyl-CoA/oxaloacetate decarboxylase gamma subunit